MKTGICYIAGAGECSRLLLSPSEKDMVIAVDGGYEYLKEQRIDMVVGDFDSLSYIPEHPNVRLLPAQKDDTDMLAAIKEGLKAGYRTFHIFGGCGGRLDHTIANIQTLAFLTEHGARGFLFHENMVLTMIKNETFLLPSYQKGYVSIFAYGDRAEGVTLKGLKYPLEKAELTSHFPVGVSNEFTGQPAGITVEKGSLLVIYFREQQAG